MTRRGALLNALDVLVPVALLVALVGGAHLIGYNLPQAMRDVWVGLSECISR